MKITSVIILVSISLCASLCCSGDDDYFAPEILIENNAIVQIENNQTEFNVNESITIETYISNAQTTINNQNIILSDFDYAEVNQSRYYYNLALYKLNGFGTVSQIPLTTDSITNFNGETLINGNYIEVISYFDGSGYKNKFTITLAESGTYYLAGLNFLNANTGEFTIHGGIYEFGFINIKSTISNSNANAAYQFIVN